MQGCSVKRNSKKQYPNNDSLHSPTRKIIIIGFCWKSKSFCAQIASASAFFLQGDLRFEVPSSPSSTSARLDDQTTANSLLARTKGALHVKGGLNLFCLSTSTAVKIIYLISFFHTWGNFPCKTDYYHSVTLDRFRKLHLISGVS